MNTLIGKKIGMTQIFSENGNAVAGTIIDVTGNVISRQIKSGDSVTHVEIGKGKKKSPLKVDLGNYKELNYVPARKMLVKVDNAEVQSVASELSADQFNVGDKINVTGVVKGKGFQGVVKRHGFKGGPRTHGQSDRERAPGSIGNRTIPGRVYKGKRMAGHMGSITTTLRNLKVAMVNKENGFIVVEGSIMGARNSYVVLKKVNK